MAKRKRYIKRAESGLFDKSDRLQQVQSMGDTLSQINAIMDWEIFLPVLDRIPAADPKGPGGRPPFHPMFMFKILVLQSLYGLSDEQTQYQILDRRSFHDFLDITEADTVPDQNTIREFREKLTRSGLHDELFAAYASRLEQKGFITRKGNIVDASFVEVPRQRNRRGENESIKRGEVPDGWEQDPKRLSHKDIDAKWTKKNQQTFYGYKNHANVDLESKLIVRAEVIDASVHDSQALDSVTREGDAETWLDAGYVGPACETVLAGKGIPAKVCEKGTRKHTQALANSKAKAQQQGEIAEAVPGRACLRIYDDEHESDGEAIHRIEKEPGIHHLLQPGLQHSSNRTNHPAETTRPKDTKLLLINTSPAQIYNQDRCHGPPEVPKTATRA